MTGSFAKFILLQPGAHYEKPNTMRGDGAINADAVFAFAQAGEQPPAGLRNAETLQAACPMANRTALITSMTTAKTKYSRSVNMPSFRTGDQTGLDSFDKGGIRHE